MTALHQGVCAVQGDTDLKNMSTLAAWLCLAGGLACVQAVTASAAKQQLSMTFAVVELAPQQPLGRCAMDTMDQAGQTP